VVLNLASLSETFLSAARTFSVRSALSLTAAWAFGESVSTAKEIVTVVGRAITAALPVISMVEGLSSAKAGTARPRSKKGTKKKKTDFLIIAELHDEWLSRAAGQQDVCMIYAN
jgi:hypothetical protein